MKEVGNTVYRHWFLLVYIAAIATAILVFHILDVV